MLESAEKASLIEVGGDLSVREQCEILGLNRSNLYYLPHPRVRIEGELKEQVMQRIDYWNTLEPAWGQRKLWQVLQAEEYDVSRDTVRELMGEMGIITIYPGQNLSKATANARKVPYLLRSLRQNGLIWLPNLVWSIDITYIKMGKSHLYLTAIIDWFSKYLLEWELSDSLETAAVIDVMNRAFNKFGVPAIANSDQGSQFTSDEYKQLLLEHGVRQSMDGKGRWADNIAIERWFRTLKTNNIYIFDYQSPRELRIGIHDFVGRYNTVRPHESLQNRTPKVVYESYFRS